MRCCLRPCLATTSRVYSTKSSTSRTGILTQRIQRKHWNGSALPAPQTDDLDPLNRSPHKRRFEPWPLSAWSNDVEFTPVTLKSNTQPTPLVHRVQLDIGDGINSYTKAGQFLQIRIGDSKPAFMAIASPPSDTMTPSVIDLLVKCTGETAEALCQLVPGSDVEASEVMGNGFPIEKIPPVDVPQVWIFATGTGIAPISAVLDSPSFEISEREMVKLYYGVKNADSNPVASEFETWLNNYENLSIEVVYSEENGEYIQGALMKEISKVDGPNAGVLLSGQREMCMTVTSAMTEAGVLPERVLLNF